MANNLTGDFEAVLQVSLQQINGVLASIHQARVDPKASPGFAHSARMRIGPSPLSMVADMIRFKGWTTMALAGQVRSPSTSSTSTTSSYEEPRQFLSGYAPPGLKVLYKKHWDQIDTSIAEPSWTDAVRGLAEVQIGNPTMSMQPEWTSKVLVHAQVRARFIPDPGAQALPAPIHGEVRAIYTVGPRQLSDGRRIVRVRVSASDQDIQFVPLAGTISGAQAATIAEEVRYQLRTRFAPLDITVDSNFAFAELGTVGSGPQQALVLPLSLSNEAAEGTIGAITQQFLGGHEFAIAVSREFVQTFMNVFVEELKTQAKIRIKTFLADYDASVTTLTLSWKPGYLELAGYIVLTTDSIFPNGFISFKQSLVPTLDAASQILSLVAQGDPAVDESWWLPHSVAVGAVKSARDAALPDTSKRFNKTADGARTRLIRALQSFDKTASATYATVETTTDGLILRGAISTSWRLPPVVTFDETDSGTAFSALNSWIPGGRIDSFTWSWVEQTSVIPWFNKATVVDDDHRFVTTTIALCSPSRRDWPTHHASVC
jgi:hypothetical protein